MVPMGEDARCEREAEVERPGKTDARPRGRAGPDPDDTIELHLPGTDAIEEGFARKFLFERGAGLPPLEILVCRVDGRLFALHSLCPHAGGRLAEGPLSQGRYPSCPLHLYKFDPASGEALAVECEPATTYAIEEHGGAAVLRGPRRPEPPERSAGDGSDGLDEADARA